MAMKGGGGQLVSTSVSWMKGIFHLDPLAAAGDTLCPFRRKNSEMGSSDSPMVMFDDLSSFAGCWGAPVPRKPDVVGRDS